MVPEGRRQGDGRWTGDMSPPEGGWAGEEGSEVGLRGVGGFHEGEGKWLGGRGSVSETGCRGASSPREVLGK